MKPAQINRKKATRSIDVIPNKNSHDKKSQAKDLYVSYLGKPYTEKRLDGLNLLDPDEDIQQIIAGENHLFMISKDNKIYGVGNNNFGQLAQPNFKAVKTPLNLLLREKISISNIYTGANFAFAITIKYETYSWGSNCKGQLGQNHFMDVAVPTKVSTLSHCQRKGNSLMQTFSECILNLNEIVVEVACGALHTIVLTNQNRIFSAGYGENFALGHGNSRTYNVFQEVTYFSEVTHNIEKIGAGVTHSACLINGQLYAWGTLGLSKFLLHKKPNAVVINEEIMDFVLGDMLTVMLTSNGEIYTMGENIDFQLGYRNNNTFTPVKVKLPYKIEYVSCGLNHVLVISKSKILAWGSNRHGQIKPNSTEKVFENLEELDWLGEAVPLNIVCGYFQTYIISKSRLTAPKTIMDNEKHLVELKKEIELFKMRHEKLKKENDKLTDEIKTLYSTLSNLDRTDDKLDSNDAVIKKYKSELRKNRTLLPNYEVDYKELKFGDKLSEGAFGIIYKGMWKELKVAIKTLKPKYLKEETIKDFLSKIIRRMCCYRSS